MQSSLLIDAQVAMMSLALIAPRTIVCLTIVPGFGLNTLQGAARYMTAMAIALPAVVPTFYYVQSTPPDFFVVAILVFKEAMVGVLLGVMLAVPFWVVQSVAAIVDSQRAAVQVQANSGSLDRDASSLGGILVAGGVYLTRDVYVEVARTGLGQAQTRLEWTVRPRLVLITTFQGNGDQRVSLRWRRETD